MGFLDAAFLCFLFASFNRVKLFLIFRTEFLVFDFQAAQLRLSRLFFFVILLDMTFHLRPSQVSRLHGHCVSV